MADEARHPRRHRRGRIEAVMCESDAPSACRVTHGVTAVAELKRQLIAWHAALARRHPRRHRRGRIEAALAGPEEIQRKVVTHGVTAVAELKHDYDL